MSVERNLLMRMYGEEVDDYAKIDADIEKYGSYTFLLDEIARLEEENEALRNSKAENTGNSRSTGNAGISEKVLEFTNEINDRVAQLGVQITEEHEELMRALGKQRQVVDFSASEISFSSD